MTILQTSIICANRIAHPVTFGHNPIRFATRPGRRTGCGAEQRTPDEAEAEAEAEILRDPPAAVVVRRGMRNGAGCVD